MILSGMGLRWIKFDFPENFSLPNLKEVTIAANKLRQIDLTVFGKCENLESLMLNGNELTKVDLDPLVSCTKLQRLWLHNNELAEIDMNITKNFPALQSLCLENNNLKGTLNLNPLSKCRVLRSLRIGGNDLSGDLDVTPLLSCKTLSSFDAGASVRFVGFTSNASELPTLPPALRRRNCSVEWKEEGQTQTPENAQGSTMTALAIGFQIRHFRSMSVLLTSSGALNIESYRDEICIDSEYLRKFSIVLVHPTNEAKLQELRIANRNIPVVVVGNGSTYADAASRCLRKGAKCFIPEPLTSRTAMSIRSLAQQYSRTHGASSFKSSLTSERRQEKSAPARTVDFKALKHAYDSRNGVVADNPRHRLEESALGMLAQRRQNNLQREDFSPVASLCGLPASASDALYDAMIRFDASVNGQVEDTGVSKALLLKYWSLKLRNFDLETRLFNVLCLPGENHVTNVTMKVLLRKLLKSRVGGFALLRSSVQGGLQNLHEEIASAIVFYGISGNLSPLRRSQLRKAEFCKVLNLAETGVFNSFVAALRPDRFQKILTVVHRSGGNDCLSLSDVILFNAEQRLLVTTAVKRIFYLYCDKNQMLPIEEFVRFYLATMDPTTVAACNYLFPALDADLDGFVSIYDLAVLYRGKEHGVEFEILWSSLFDLLRSSNSAVHHERVSCKNVLALAAKDRAMLLRTLLYIDDDIEVDIRRTS